MKMMRNSIARFNLSKVKLILMWLFLAIIKYLKWNLMGYINLLRLKFSKNWKNIHRFILNSICDRSLWHWYFVYMRCSSWFHGQNGSTGFYCISVDFKHNMDNICGYFHLTQKCQKSKIKWIIDINFDSNCIQLVSAIQMES